MNEILLSCKGTIGKIVENKIGDIHVARQFMSIKSFVTNSYLILYLQTIVSELISIAKSMIPGIDRSQILNRFIPLPPTKEQVRITNKLQHLLEYIK